MFIFLTFSFKALGSQQGRMDKIPAFKPHDLSSNQFISISTSRLVVSPLDQVGGPLSQAPCLTGTLL